MAWVLCRTCEPRRAFCTGRIFFYTAGFLALIVSVVARRLVSPKGVKPMTGQHARQGLKGAIDELTAARFAQLFR